MRRRWEPSETRWVWFAAAAVVGTVFAVLQFGLHAPGSGWLLLVLGAAAAVSAGWEHRRWRALVRSRRADAGRP